MVGCDWWAQRVRKARQVWCRGGCVLCVRSGDGRPAHRGVTPPSLAADHAAALWQLWCRVGRTTTITCQVVESHAIYHRLQRATGAGPGANAGTAQRAGDGGRTYPANQHRVCIRTLSCVRRLTMLVPIGMWPLGTARGHTRSVEHSRGARPHDAPFALNRPRRSARHGRDSRATRALAAVESTALQVEFDRSSGRIRPLFRSSRPVRTGESTIR